MLTTHPQGNHPQSCHRGSDLGGQSRQTIHPYLKHLGFLLTYQMLCRDSKTAYSCRPHSCGGMWYWKDRMVALCLASWCILHCHHRYLHYTDHLMHCSPLALPHSCSTSQGSSGDNKITADSMCWMHNNHEQPFAARQPLDDKIRLSELANHQSLALECNLLQGCMGMLVASVLQWASTCSMLMAIEST